MRMAKGAIGNLVNRYRAVLKKCYLLNTLSALAITGMCMIPVPAAATEKEPFDKYNMAVISEDRTYTQSVTINNHLYIEDNYGLTGVTKGDFDNYNFQEKSIYVYSYKTSSHLTLEKDLSITMTPPKYKGQKYEDIFEGINVSHGSVMTVGGNTSIEINAYKSVHGIDYNDMPEDSTIKTDRHRGITFGDVDSASAQGVTQKAQLDIGGNLDVVLNNGSRAVGIYDTNESVMNVDGKTSIKVHEATLYNYGISNFASGPGIWTLQTIKNNNDARLTFADLDISTRGGYNSIGIVLRDSYRNPDGEDTITVNGHMRIHATGAVDDSGGFDVTDCPEKPSNYGIFLNNIASSTFNTAEITTASTSERVESIGTYLYDNSNATFKGDVRYHTVADNAATEISALARKESTLVYEKGLVADGAVTLNAVSGSTIKVNSTEDADALVRLDGNIVVGKTHAAKINNSNKEDAEQDNDATENTISVNLLNEDSYFTGINEFGNEGSKIDLTFANGAHWNMTGDSPVSTLAMRNGGIVDLTYGNDPATTSRFRTLTADNLTGEGGIFRVNTDIKNDKTDKIIIGEGAGTHQIEVMPTGTGADREAMDSFIVQQHDGDASFSLANEDGKVEQGLYFYELADRAGSVGQEWYLKRASSGIAPETPTGEADASLSGLAGHYAMWYGQLTDLRKRLGEVRYGTQTGLWVRGFADKSRLDGLAGSSFTQNLYGGSIGYDTLAAVDEEYMWIVGMQLRSAHADQHTNGRWGGHGDLTSMGGGLYSTWVHADGWYVDAAATMDWYNHKIRATMRDGTRVHDDRSSYGLGASLEAGRKIDFGFSNEGRDHWFVEPQLQLSYFWVKGGDFTASNGMEIDQKDMDSLTGRAGLVLGKKFALDGGNGSRYIQPYVKAGLNHEFLGEQEARLNGVRMTSDLEGTRGYYGVGVDWQATDNLRLYMQAEREHGEHFTREYNVSAGVKWSF